MSAITTADELRQVYESCLSFIRSKGKHYKPVLDYYITDIADNTKVRGRSCRLHLHYPRALCDPHANHITESARTRSLAMQWQCNYDV